MSNDAPKLPYNPKDALPALRGFTLRMIEASSNAPDRQRFNDMLHVLWGVSALGVEPFPARDERAYVLSHSAVIYANLVKAARQVWGQKPQVQTTVQYLEWLVDCPPAGRDPQGDQGMGYTFVPRKAL
jgi:hypothetical protein